MQCYLYSKKWEARTAAGECLGLLAEHFVHHTPPDLAAAIGVPLDHCLAAAQLDAAAGGGQDGGAFSFASFDVGQVLEGGTPLASSSGAEFDTGDEGLSRAERIKKQRAQIKKRLGAWGIEG